MRGRRTRPSEASVVLCKAAISEETITNYSGKRRSMSSDKRIKIGQKFGAPGFSRRLRKESSGNRQEAHPALEFQ